MLPPTSASSPDPPQGLVATSSWNCLLPGTAVAISCHEHLQWSSANSEIRLLDFPPCYSHGVSKSSGSDLHPLPAFQASPGAAGSFCHTSLKPTQMSTHHSAKHTPMFSKHAISLYPKNQSQKKTLLFHKWFKGINYHRTLHADCSETKRHPCPCVSRE